MANDWTPKTDPTKDLTPEEIAALVADVRNPKKTHSENLSYRLADIIAQLQRQLADMSNSSSENANWAEQAQLRADTAETQLSEARNRPVEGWMEKFVDEFYAYSSVHEPLVSEIKKGVIALLAAHAPSLTPEERRLIDTVENIETLRAIAQAVIDRITGTADRVIEETWHISLQSQRKRKAAAIIARECPVPQLSKREEKFIGLLREHWHTLSQTTKDLISTLDRITGTGGQK